eukprot:TRINITY_DN8236_c0_g1_i1.p1 TRINITY_DN8236_c0_g1~~TRINITY_DN8236_c0_g1_i1.p1  ORF type:complete len:711 (-),score=133.16 TRINITY_DN8236_c0_g1_i1:228-2360(-)
MFAAGGGGGAAPSLRPEVVLDVEDELGPGDFGTGQPGAAEFQDPSTATRLTLEVKRREVTLAPGFELAAPQSWPCGASTTMSFEDLSIRLSVVVGGPSLGRAESLELALHPPPGARARFGGHVGADTDHWVPLMVTGERSALIAPDDAAFKRSADSAPRAATVVRAECQHDWEEEPQVADDGDGGAVGGHDGSETGSTALTESSECNAVFGGPISPDASLCLVGFAMRARLRVSATLYRGPAAEDAPGRRHTLMVNGTGTLQLRPKLVDFRRLGLARLVAAAKEDLRRGDHSASLQKLRHALPVQERRAHYCGSQEYVRLGSVLHSMGVAYNSLGYQREALSCLRRALAIRQHVHGEEHPESARTLQSLGVVRVRDGEYHEAFEYFWQALRYYEAFEPDSLDAAGTLQAVAGVYGKLGEYSEALECYVRVLAIRERELGKDHPDVATTLHNLGVVLEKHHDHSEALESLQRALAIRERRLGPFHPQTARTLHSIGIVYSQMPDYSMALAFYQRALDICQRMPQERTHVAATLNNMGVVHAKLGQVELAMQHHRQALTIQEQVLGPVHADTAATRYNLDVLYAEVEAKRQLTFFDQMRLFFSSALEADVRPLSLLTVFCEESNEAAAPMLQGINAESACYRPETLSDLSRCGRQPQCMPVRPPTAEEAPGARWNAMPGLDVKPGRQLRPPELNRPQAPSRGQALAPGKLSL